MPGINTHDGIPVIMIDPATGSPITFGAGGTASQVEGTTASGASYTAPGINPILIGFANSDNGFLQRWLGFTLADGKTFGTGLPPVASFPMRLNTAGTFDRDRNYIGTHGNISGAISAGGTSTAIDVSYADSVAIFGSSSAATTLTVQLSQDNTNFYDVNISYGPGAAGNFGSSFACGARFIRLKSSIATTLTATIAGKGL